MAETAVTTNKKLAKFGASAFEYGVVGDDDFVQKTRKIQGLLKQSKRRCPLMMART